MIFFQFQVEKKNLTNTRLMQADAPALKEGEILLKIDRFALTANNITYGIVGERIGYWNFFPTSEQGWGVIPVWGFADVVESRHEDVKTGERLYGYFPMGLHLVIRPARIKPARLFDGSDHRAELPPVYNAYARVRAEAGYDPAMDDERILLYPLYATSFCLYDFLIAHDWFGADADNKGQVIIPSASSKTALGLAYAIAADDTAPQLIGLTSSRNLDAIRALGLYDSLLTYEECDHISHTRPSVIVDMSGNGPLLNQLHNHLGDQMRYCSNVGLTHYEENNMGPDFIRERSAMFFAPGHILQRNNEWGAGVFEQKALAFWRDTSLKSRDWLEIKQHMGIDAIEKIYREVLAGEVPANEGHIVVV